MDTPGARYLEAEDRAVMAASGYGRDGPVPTRPALLVIDMTWDFCGPKGLGREAAAQAVRTACGPSAWAAIPAMIGILDAARAAGIPRIYTRRDATRLSQTRFKSGRGGEDTASGNAIVDPITPQAGDTVIGKSKPSAFWRTELDAILDAAGCDGVILTGCTTSGCVRATAVDAFNRDMPCLVVADAVFDRFTASHAIALFDMQAKYADLVSADRARAIIQG